MTEKTKDQSEEAKPATTPESDLFEDLTSLQTKVTTLQSVVAEVSKEN